MLLCRFTLDAYYTFSKENNKDCIGVGPITQYTHVRYKNSNTQWSSPNAVKVNYKELLLKERIHSPWERSSNLKRDIIVDNIDA